MAAGELTCRDLVAEYLERIDAYDRDGPELSSIVTVADGALERAAELDEAFNEHRTVGPLHGIPVLVKDQVETAGTRTTFGSAAFADYVPSTDATIVRKLRDAGAIVLAKTNLPDWGASWFGHSSVRGQTKNPYAPAHDPGGSSAGTGAATAANLGTIGIGGDTGGSIRIPASCCNLYGLRVTTGLISRRGIAPLVDRQDTAGPMTRTVEDLARLLDVLVGFDPDDEWTGVEALADVDASYTTALDQTALEGARLGVLRSSFGEMPEAEPVNDVVDAALETMDAAGAKLIDPIEIPELHSQLSDSALFAHQARANIDEFLARRDTAPVDSIDEVYESGAYHDDLQLFEQLADGPADPTDDPEYWHRVAAQGALRRAILHVFAAEDLDAMVFPSVQVPPPAIDHLSDGVVYRTNTVIASQSSCPAISIPAGFTDDGLPVGVELLGAPYAERNLLGLASAFEATADTRRPPQSAPALSE
uniref:Amidase n=2 Tax=Natrinema halophilum TaxID=1699371 RepID=A0A7D5KTE8_9EURY